MHEGTVESSTQQRSIADRIRVLILAISAFAAVGGRAWIEISHIRQPIYEGYVGRQIPTAMVARGLARDGSFLYPRLQTGPFPSWFVIEPPIYAQAVALLVRILPLPLESCGRIVSLMALVLGTVALGAIGLRRFGPFEAGWAIVLMLSMPVSIRYARSVQPDMFALGSFLLGIWLSELARAQAQKGRDSHALAISAWLALATAIASKATLAPLLIGLTCSGDRMANRRNLRFLASTLVPAIMWYAWAAWLTMSSRAGAGGQSADGFAFWLNAPGPLSLLDQDKLRAVIENFAFKAWSPIWLIFLTTLPALWRVSPKARRWAFALAVWFLIVGGKAHHGYYWLVPTPFLALLGGQWMAHSGQGSVLGPAIVAVGKQLVGVGMVTMSVLMAADTFDTPPEWIPLTRDLHEIRAWIDTTPGKTFIGHEAAVFAVDRPGFRWEWSAAAQRRAASAFGERLAGESPRELLDFYRNRGAAWFLAIEIDPDWIRDGRRLREILGENRIVHRSGGLVLYELTDNVAPAKRP